MLLSNGFFFFFFFTFINQIHISPLVPKRREESARKDEHRIGKVNSVWLPFILRKPSFLTPLPEIGNKIWH